MAIPIIIAIDLYKVGNAAIEDTKNGTSRKTVETSAQIGSGWVGAYTGINIDFFRYLFSNKLMITT